MCEDMNVQIKNTKIVAAEVSASEVIDALNDADTAFKAQEALHRLYGDSSEDADKAFTSPVELDWNLFYKAVEKEKEFHLEHDASAYYAINLVETKLKHMWSTKDQGPKKWSEYDDFRTAVWAMIRQKLSPSVNKKGKTVGWDPSINDNFLAFIIPEIRTVLNEITRSDISKYMSTKNGWSIGSLEEMMEDEDNPLQVAGKTVDVEDAVLEQMEHDKRRHIYDVPGSHNGDLTKTLTDMLTMQKMFGGISEKDLDLAEKYTMRSLEMQAFAEALEELDQSSLEEDAREAV